MTTPKTLRSALLQIAERIDNDIPPIRGGDVAAVRAAGLIRAEADRHPDDQLLPLMPELVMPELISTGSILRVEALHAATHYRIGNDDADVSDVLATADAFLAWLQDGAETPQETS